MIFLQVKGGLGNQLFQYSVAYFLQKRIGSDLCLDYSSAKVGKLLKSSGVKKSFTFRDIQLECFYLDSHRIQSSAFTFFIDKIVKKISKSKGFTGRKIVKVLREEDKDCRENNQDILETADGSHDIILSGYWQNIHYIDPIRNDLIRQLKMKLNTCCEYNETQKVILSCESIGVHVRRGDFVALGWDKGADYYVNAMNAARETIPNARFFFFSDDMEWVKENLFDRDDSTLVTISENDADVKEFSLLSNCKNQIISESTFGWWAAYLNENPQKQVFIPFDCRGDIWLEKWNRIEYSKN